MEPGAMFASKYSWLCCSHSQTALLSLLVAVVLALPTASVAEDCPRMQGRSCAWQCSSSKYIIDFSPYDTPKEQHPMFKDVKSSIKTDSATYSYDPCIPMDNGACSGALLCQKMADGTLFKLGGLSSAKYQRDSVGSLKVLFSTKDRRNSQVDLLYGPTPKFEARGESSVRSKTYNFTMYSPYLQESTPGLSPGSIMLIIVLVLVLVYIIGGMLYLRFAHGARGKEMIPNYDFWEDFPLLVRDGVVFVSKGCKPDPTYQQI